MLGELGQGGFGRVLRCYDRDQQQEVALKELHRFGADALLRFKKEFRALADIHHANLVRLGELLESADRRWAFTMELVPGTDFLTWVRGGRSSPGFDEARLRAGLTQLAQGLDALHQLGMLHRDIKPENLRVTPGGRLVLLDFGLVSHFERGKQTTESAALGTAAYMSPEQIDQPVGPETDLYAVGVVLYEALTGGLPFDGSAIDILLRKLHEDPVPPAVHNPHVPAELQDLCMSLLDRRPGARPTAERVLEILGEAPRRTERLSRPPRPSDGSLEPFVGRHAQLRALDRCWASVREAGLRSVLVEGPSGIGKTALVEHFVRRLRARESGLLVLKGRCHPAERLRYKAWDGVVDALCRHLRCLATLACEAVLPTNADLITTLFPVLGEVPAMPRPPAQPREPADPVADRVAAFTAFGEMLEKLGRQRPFLIVIDDLQWGDVDSLAILKVLCSLRRSPSFMLAATIRSFEDLPGDLRARLEELDATHRRVERVAVPPLSQAEVAQLTACLLPARPDHRAVQRMAAQTEGNPWLLREMVEHLGRLETDALREVDLSAALRERLAQLGVGARAVMELLAVAGGPQPTVVVREALKLAGDELGDALAALRTNRFVRATQPGRWVCYHDRVREAVLQDVLDSVARGIHAKLALAWQKFGADHLRIAQHWQAAAEDARALPWLERAAAEAARAGAYDQAAQLYADVLALRSKMGAGEAALQVIRARLAETLASAGRASESAQVLLAMIEQASDGDRPVLLVRAAERLLQAGMVSDGLVAARHAFCALGLAWPRTPSRALYRLLWNRLRIALGGLDMDGHGRPTESQRVEFEALWRLLKPMAWVALLPSVELSSRHLCKALGAGDREQAARALLDEAVVQTLTSPDRRRAAELLVRAELWIHELRLPSLYAYHQFVLGTCASIVENKRAALTHLARADEHYRGDCAEEAWMRSNTRAQLLSGWYWSGSHARWSLEAERWLVEAAMRQDAFAEASYSALGFGALRHCQQEAPERGLRELARVTSPWRAETPGALQVAEAVVRHWIARYVGRGQAEAHWQQTWPELKRSFVGRLRFYRDLLTFLRLEAALAAGVERAPASFCTRAVASLAREAERARTPAARSWGACILAEHALVVGRVDRALALLRGMQDQADGHLYHRHAALLQAHCRGARHGLAAEAELLAWYEAEGWANPERALASHLAIYPWLRRCWGRGA